MLIIYLLLITKMSLVAPLKYIFCKVEDCGIITLNLGFVNPVQHKMVVPARWCSGESVRFAVGRPGVHSPSRVIPKDFKNWYSQLPCLALSIKTG